MLPVEYAGCGRKMRPVDVVSVLNDTDYQTAINYWSVLKVRLKSEGYEPTTFCSQLKKQSS